MNLCDKCKMNNATMHLEKTINNVKTEYNLCTKCANNFDDEASFDDFFKGFLQAMFSFQTEPSLEKPSLYTSPVCKTCGLTYSKFKQTSRFGCADCYDTFRTQIDIVLKNIQGCNRHEGKYPNKSGAELLRLKQIGELKASLLKMIEDEEYEKAAMLRDQIKEMQIKTTQ